MVSDESTCCDLLLRKRLSGSKEKLTSLLFNRENCTTLIHRFQSRYSISLMFLFWNVSILLRAFLRSDFQKRNRVWGNTCRKKVPLHPRGFPLQSSASTRVKPSLLTKTKVTFRFSPSLAELPVLITVYPNA